MNSTLRKTLVYVVFLGLACVLMYFLYRNVSWSKDILPNLKGANWPLVILSFMLGYLATVFRGLRWNILLEPMKYKVSPWTAIHSVAFGYSMNNLVPRSGELARCTLLYKAEKVPVDKLIGTVILERVVDVLLLGCLLLSAFVLHADALQHLLAPAGSASTGSSSSATVVVWLAVIAVSGLGLAYWIATRLNHITIVAKVLSFLKGIWEGMKTIFAIRRKALFVAYSLGIWMCWTSMTFAILKALPFTAHLNFSDTIFFMAAGSLGMVVPTPGGMGAFHGMSELAFAALGYDRVAGKVFALISWSAKTLFDTLIGFVGFFIVTRKMNRK
jgi:glycosyltransferase 2 family protein